MHFIFKWLSICRGAHVVDFDQAHIPLSHLAASILLQLHDPSSLDLLPRNSSPHAASLRNLRSHASKWMGTRATVSWCLYGWKVDHTIIK